MPSGQAIAGAMGATALGPDAFGELASYRLGLEASTPLWYYVLKEAELLEDGLQLGPVGGRIVAEVFIGLLQFDRDSSSTPPPTGGPRCPGGRGRSGAVDGSYAMVDFLTFASVDPLRRGQ